MIMPKVDGWHLAAEINNDKGINNAKLYLIVPEGQIGSDAKMKMLNWFDGYLYKPIKRKKLFDLVSQSFKESFETAVSGLSVTPSLPFIAVTSDLHIESPSPVPPYFLVVEVSA